MLNPPRMGFAPIVMKARTQHKVAKALAGQASVLVVVAEDVENLLGLGDNVVGVLLNR
jgi:hypothetical protein